MGDDIVGRNEALKHFGGEQADTGVMVLGVVPGKEDLAEIAGSAVGIIPENDFGSGSLLIRRRLLPGAHSEMG